MYPTLAEQPRLHLDGHRPAPGRLEGLRERNAADKGGRDRVQPGKSESIPAEIAAQDGRRPSWSTRADDTAIMQEEIFGPLLPVIGYKVAAQPVAYQQA